MSGVGSWFVKLSIYHEVMCGLRTFSQLIGGIGKVRSDFCNLKLINKYCYCCIVNPWQWKCLLFGFERRKLKYFAFLQRQRLRQLLIRQQIQRNNLRQEKEQAAACGSSTATTNWSQENSSQPHELQTRAPPPYPLSQVLTDTGYPIL